MAMPSDLYATQLSSIESAEVLCDIARPLIRNKARRLLWRPTFRLDDLEDIEHEVIVRLLQRFERARRRDLPVLAFIGQVVDQSIANQIRSRIARKRDSLGMQSLSAPSGDPDGPGELGDVVDQSHLDATRGQHPRDAFDLTDLGLDLEQTLAQLATEQQQLCEALGVDSISALAGRWNVSRRTLRDRVRAVRQRMEEAGLRDYLD
jgi:DNA-directed RNA polymerase specialized sigma24 family protein